MEYLKPKFTLPASTGKVTQEEWDRIFADVKVSEKPAPIPDWLNICKALPGPALRTSKKS